MTCYEHLNINRIKKPLILTYIRNITEYRLSILCSSIVIYCKILLPVKSATRQVFAVYMLWPVWHTSWLVVFEVYFNLRVIKKKKITLNIGFSYIYNSTVIRRQAQCAKVCYYRCVQQPKRAELTHKFVCLPNIKALLEFWQSEERENRQSCHLH